MLSLLFLFIFIIAPISLGIIFKAAKDAEGSAANDPYAPQRKEEEQYKWQEMINRVFRELAPLYKRRDPYIMYQTGDPYLNNKDLRLKIEQLLSFHLTKEPRTILRSFYEVTCLYRRSYPHLTTEEALSKVEKTLEFQPEIYFRERILQFLELAYLFKAETHHLTDEAIRIKVEKTLRDYAIQEKMQKSQASMASSRRSIDNTLWWLDFFIK